MIRLHSNVRASLASDTVHSTRMTGLALAAPLALLLVTMPFVASVHAETRKPTIATANATQPALLAEIRKNLVQSGKYSAIEIDSVIAELRNKSVEEIKAIADFSGKAASGAERLVGPGVGQDARDRAGQLIGSSGTASSSSGNGAQRGVQSELAGGGINDTRGQDATGCTACPGPVKEGQPAKQAGQENGGPINAGNGDVIQRWNDGSASIKRPNGTTEYLNSQNQLVDRNGNAVTPNPEDNTPGGSGRLTAADVRRIGALLGSKSEPDPNSSKGGTGGGVNDTKANRTGTLGLYTEGATGTYTSKTEIKEIIRISVEKLQGPQVGK